MPRVPPRTILYQRKRANRRILNEELFLGVLREFGEARGHEPPLTVRACVQTGSFSVSSIQFLFNSVLIDPVLVPQIGSTQNLNLWFLDGNLTQDLNLEMGVGCGVECRRTRLDHAAGCRESMKSGP